MAGRLWYDKQPQQQPDIPQQQRCQQKTRGADKTEEEEEEKAEEEEDDLRERNLINDPLPFRSPTGREVTSYHVLPESSGSLGFVSLSLFCTSPLPHFRLPGRAPRLLAGKKYPPSAFDHFPTRKPIFKRQRRLEENFFRRPHFSYDNLLKLKKNKPNSTKLLVGREFRTPPPTLTHSKPFVASSRRGDFVEDKSRVRLSAFPPNRHLAWRVGPADAPADAARACTIAATVISLRPAAQQSPCRTDTTAAHEFNHVVLQPLSQKVVYAADSVSDQQGSGMASRSFHSLPSTTTTTTTTTTTSTISNHSSSRNVAYATNTSSSSQQQQHHHHKHNNHHHQNHHQRQQDNYYPRDHLQAHQPHTINPGGLQYQYTLQTSKSQHQQQQCLQQCCAQGTVLGPAMPHACLSQYFPARIALPDGEERSHGAGLGRHSKEKVSELKRPYIKAPANKTLFDVQHCKARLSPTSPGDLNQLPCQLHANAHYCSPHLPASPTPPPPLSPTQHTLSRQHKHQSREKDGGRGGGAHMSPQPTRKSKNLIANYMATLTSSPKNRKESNLRKSSQQNSGYSNSSSSSCSSDSSSSSSNANSCCNSTKMIFGMSGGRDRIRGPSTTSGVPSVIPSERDHLQGYSTLSSSLPSPELPAIEASLRDSFTPSVLTEPSTEGLSSSISCSTGPSSVSDVTLLGCHPSSLNACSHSSCNISHQKNPIQYQQQHYQQPQYLQPQYHHHDHRPHSPQPPLEDSDTSPPHYNKLSYAHHQQQQHNPLTSSISSSPPASPSCPSLPPSTSPEQFEELSGLPSRGVVQTPQDGSSQLMQEGIAVCPTPRSAARDSRSYNRRPSSLTSDEILLQSQQPPSYREVLEHPDRFREPPPSYSTTSSSSSSTNTRNSISLTSVPCDNDSIEGGSFNSPDGATREEATSRSRGGAEYGGQDRQRCSDHPRSHGPDSESSSEGEEGPGQGPNQLSERQRSPTSSREALYGSCYEKEVI